MSKKHRPFASCRFCPQCGVAGLQREPNVARRSHKVEYLCQTCGFSFTIGPSNSYATAIELFARDREVREGSFYANVTPEARLEYERNNPEPLRFRLWRFARRLQGIKPDES